MRPELPRFIIIGGGAAATHYTVALALVHSGLEPQRANVLAFLVAFNVSYLGHRFWTFADTHLRHRESLPRFAVVAGSSFALNALLFHLLLRYTGMPYYLALALVLVAVAALTFFTSRLWAFVRH